MALNSVPKHFRFLSECSVNGVFIPEGYLCPLVYSGAFSTIFVNLRCDVPYTFNMYACPTNEEDERTLFFSKTFPSGGKFSKKFAITKSYFQVEVLNTTTTAGKIYLNTSASVSCQYASQTFLNSKISIDDNTALQRISNNYEVDLVRGIQEDFKKINIQGIQRTLPSVEETIGLGDDYKYTTTGFDTQLQVSGTNDNNPAGTGARLMSFTGLDDSGVEQTENITINTGTGTVGVNYMAINRMTVSSVGSLTHNEGDITFLGSGGAVLGKMFATQNVSHFAYFKVPTGKQLIVRDINICAYAPGGKVIVYEFDPSTTIQASIGEFLITTSYQQLSYTLDGLITAGKVIKVNYQPGTGTGDILININVNAVLCPDISAF
jgi:hypothetical protein